MKTQFPYYVQTKDQIVSLIFAEVFQNKEKFLIGFPKLIPSEKTNKTIIFEGKDYQRGSNYSEWFQSKKQIYSKYIKYIQAFDAALYAVPKASIIKKYHPLSFLKVSENQKDLHLKNVSELIDVLADELDISKKSIGVEGSTLLKYYNRNSDIDLIVYGYENSLNLQKNFKDISNKKVSFLNPKHFHQIYLDRKNIGFGGFYSSIIEQQLRRFYGFFNGIKFSIVGSTPFVKNYISLNRKLKFKEIIDEEVVITDCRYSSLTPSVYECRTLEKPERQFKIEIYNHYGINQANIGEIFHIKGNLFVDVTSGELIIIQAFWSGIKECFNLLNKSNG